MSPNIRKKLHEIDHLLDDEYETVRINFKESVEVDDSEGNMSRGVKKCVVVKRRQKRSQWSLRKM